MRSREPVDFGRELVEAFLVSERVNQRLLDLLAPRVWRTFPPSSPRRCIATSFAHIHNVRCMKINMAGGAAPERLDRADADMDQVRRALGAGAEAFAERIEACVASGGRVPKCTSNVVVWTFAAVAHEAHHRGQIMHWARELGAPISTAESLPLWDWDKRRRDAE